jgi:hypothetical protein
LLITAKSNKLRDTLLGTSGLLQDIYTSNKDGLGAMYADNGVMKIRKILPRNLDDITKFFEALPQDERDLAIHFRMRTHGDIDMANCHPYKINDGSWLMHNGVLKTGNTKDKKKSDTWHFIQDYLATLSVDVLHHEPMVKLIGDFIGDNRFAIMSADGRLTVVNKDQGIEHDGIWFSNEYAWSPELLIPGYASQSSYFRGWGGHMGGHGWDVWEREIERAEAPLATLMENIDGAVEDYDVNTLAECLQQQPEATIEYLICEYTITPYAKTPDAELTARGVWLRNCWCQGREHDLVDYIALHDGNAEKAAEALLYTCDLGRLLEDDEAPVADAIDYVG